MAVSDDIVTSVEAAGLPLAILIVHYGKGHAFAGTDPEVALAAFERVVAVAQNSGNRMFETVVIPEIAALQARSGNMAAALGSFRAMLDTWRGTAEALLISHGIGGLVILFERLGRRETAALLHGMLESAFPSNPCVEELPAAMTRVREALDQALFDKISRRGAAMDLQKVIEFAQGEISYALAELGQIEYQASGTP